MGRLPYAALALFGKQGLGCPGFTFFEGNNNEKELFLIGLVTVCYHSFFSFLKKTLKFASQILIFKIL